MTDDIGAYRKVAFLPSPQRYARMKAERDRAIARAVEEQSRRAEAAIEDALFDEAIERRIAEIAA